MPIFPARLENRAVAKTSWLDSGRKAPFRYEVSVMIRGLSCFLKHDLITAKQHKKFLEAKDRLIGLAFNAHLLMN